MGCNIFCGDWEENGGNWTSQVNFVFPSLLKQTQQRILPLPHPAFFTAVVYICNITFGVQNGCLNKQSSYFKNPSGLWLISLRKEGGEKESLGLQDCIWEGKLLCIIWRVMGWAASTGDFVDPQDSNSSLSHSRLCWTLNPSCVSLGFEHSIQTQSCGHRYSSRNVKNWLKPTALMFII